MNYYIISLFKIPLLYTIHKLEQPIVYKTDFNAHQLFTYSSINAKVYTRCLRFYGF